MLKLLFITHSGLTTPPLALSIMKKIIADAGLSDKFSLAAAHLGTGEGVLPAKAAEVLAEEGIPTDTEPCRRLEWSDYDKYDFLLLLDDREKWAFMKIIGGDPDEKVHLLSEYAGVHGNIVSPGEEGTYRDGYEPSFFACKGLFEKLRDWVS